MRTLRRTSRRTEIEPEASAPRGPPASPQVQRILHLQRAAGNQAVARLLHRQPAEKTATVDEEADKRKATVMRIYRLGDKAFKAGRFAQAYDFFMHAYELWPTERILFSAAQALRRLGGRRQEAIELYERYLASGDTLRKEDAASLLAELRGPAKTGDEAADKTAAKLVYRKADAHYKAGRFAQAYDFFMHAYELWPTERILFSAAQALRRLGGRRQEAIELYERYLASGDTLRKEDAASLLAELRGPAKTGDEAADKTAAKLVYRKADAHYKAGRFAQAYDFFMHAYELWPTERILFSAAQALRRLGGRRQEAIELYERYLASGDTLRKEDAASLLAELRESGAAP